MQSIQQHMAEVVQAVSDKVLTQLQAVAVTVDGVQNNIGDYIKGITYLHGHLSEIATTISQWGLDANPNPDMSLVWKRFPLIALLEDKSELPPPSASGYTKCRLNMVIAFASQPNWVSAQRELFTFDPILRPIYAAFKEALQEDGYFAIYSEADMPHQAYDRKYWGTESETKNRFNNYIDAIEIQNLEVKIFPNDC